MPAIKNLRRYPLTAPCYMNFTFAVPLADQQALDNGHRNVEFFEYGRLFHDFPCLDELVQPLQRR